MINIKIHEFAFSPTGIFASHPYSPKKTVVHVGSGRNDLYVGKRNPGSQVLLKLDRTGTTMSDYMFENLMQSEEYKGAYAGQILDLVEQEAIEVWHDGAKLSATGVATFKA